MGTGYKGILQPSNGLKKMGGKDSIAQITDPSLQQSDNKMETMI